MMNQGNLLDVSDFSLTFSSQFGDFSFVARHYSQVCLQHLKRRRGRTLLAVEVAEPQVSKR